MRVVLNVASVLLLTFLLVRLDEWSDTVAGAVNAFSQTALWVWFRSAFGVHGPEDEQTLMMATLVGVALVFSMALVWAVNRAASRLVSGSDAAS